MKNLWVDAPLRTSGARAPAWLMCTFDESKFAQYSVKADRVTTSTISSHGASLGAQFDWVDSGNFTPFWGETRVTQGEAHPPNRLPEPLLASPSAEALLGDYPTVTISLECRKLQSICSKDRNEQDSGIGICRPSQTLQTEWQENFKGAGHKEAPGETGLHMRTCSTRMLPDSRSLWENTTGEAQLAHMRCSSSTSAAMPSRFTWKKGHKGNDVSSTKGGLAHHVQYETRAGQKQERDVAGLGQEE
eukprot:1158113-Pelagomonas_calceolata.AAC.2